MGNDLELTHFDDESLMESIYSLSKQKAFLNAITANPLNKSERFKRSLSHWELFIKLFILSITI